jgi:glycosyltransferase involved in cell wall biosynthesis
MGRRPRVVYWSNIPAPYVIDRFNAVSRRGSLDFEAWFCSRIEPDRSWDVDESEWLFPHRYLPGKQVRLPGMAPHYFNIPGRLRRGRPDLLVSLYADPAFLTGWALARLRGIRTAFRVLPTFDAWVRRSRLKEWLKGSVFPRVDGFKVPGPDGAAAVLKYGVDPGRIHVVTQSIDAARFQRGWERWFPQRDGIRKELGVHGCVFIFVGRIWAGKGLDHLLEAYRMLLDTSLDVSLLIVGDGPDEERYRAYCRNHALRNVVFAGFHQQAELPRLYAASDVLVFPTLGDPNGLVVDEAMASHLPVVTSDAAGDIRSRVPEGLAGYVVPAGDPRAMADRMTALATSAPTRMAMGAFASQIASTKVHERYAQDFEQFVEAVLTSPRIHD